MVLSLFAAPFVAASMGIERAKSIVAQSIRSGSDWRGELRARLDDLAGECERLPIREPFLERIRRFQERCTNQIYYRDAAAIVTAIHELQLDFMAELESTIFVVLPPSAALQWKRPEQDWAAAALQAFPIGQDARAASRCLAIGEWTACVFHSMAVMQRGLEWLAQQLGDVPYAYENWQNIIKDIEASVRRREQALSKGAAKSAEMTFYGEAASHFFFVKEAWRNHIAHSRVTYDEQEATDVIAHVRGFMSALAKKA